MLHAVRRTFSPSDPNYGAWPRNLMADALFPAFRTAKVENDQNSMRSLVAEIRRRVLSPTLGKQYLAPLQQDLKQAIREMF